MRTTKVFKNGNSQAVRIPADLAYGQNEMEVEIERVGEELRIGRCGLRLRVFLIGLRVSARPSWPKVVAIRSKWSGMPSDGALYARHQHLQLSDEAPAAGSRPAVRRMQSRDVVISAITFAELEYGVSVSINPESERTNLEFLIEAIPVASFDSDAARACGPVRQATRERKQDHLEKQIAALPWL